MRKQRNSILFSICFVCLAVSASQTNAQSAGTKELSPKIVKASKLLAQEAAEIQMQIARAEQSLAETQAKLSKQFDEVNASSVSDIAFEDVFRMLHLQNAELSIDLEGLNARLDLLKAKAAPQKKKGGVEDTQRELLQKYVENQTKRFETHQRLFSKGASSEQDVANAEALLVEAKLRLEQFEADSRKGSPAMVEAIFETSLEIAEKKARLEAVSKMLRKHTDVRPTVSDIAELKEQAASEKLVRRQLLMHLRNIELKLAAEKDGKF